MSFKQLNPGNINVRLGAVQALMEQAAAEGNLERHANLLERMATYVSVFMDAKQMREYEAMPGFSYGDDRSAAEIYAALNRRERYLLAIARKHGVFTRAPDLELGDASSLDEEEVAA